MIKAGIYLHIPFCRKKCIYCDFYSLPERENAIPRFVKALTAEIERSQVDTSGWEFDTLFFGGGTPSLLTPDHLEQILTALERKFPLSRVREITLEANPGEVSLERLKAFRSLGVNRLSLGFQSLSNDLLRFLTRIHTAADALASFQAARTAGFDNINCDLIFGIPGQTEERWQRDLQRVVELSPEHLAVYALTVEENTPLHTLTTSGDIVLPADSEFAACYRWTQDFLEHNGYHQYEISNFARPGRTCRHNLHYWRIEPYLGFGPSAHSFDGRRRWKNIADLNRYLDRIENQQPVIVERERLTARELTNERVGFGLRLAEGVDLSRIPGTHREALDRLIDQARKTWEDYFRFDEQRLVLTRRGMLFADAIAVDLTLAAQRRSPARSPGDQ
jgi:oxygen-independent coproporphyrinogen-3 oxidase